MIFLEESNIDNKLSNLVLESIGEEYKSSNIFSLIPMKAKL